jgi:hypothetical protein
MHVLDHLVVFSEVAGHGLTDYVARVTEDHIISARWQPEKMHPIESTSCLKNTFHYLSD